MIREGIRYSVLHYLSENIDPPGDIPLETLCVERDIHPTSSSSPVTNYPAVSHPARQPELRLLAPAPPRVVPRALLSREARAPRGVGAWGRAETSETVPLPAQHSDAPPPSRPMHAPLDFAKGIFQDKQLR